MIDNLASRGQNKNQQPKKTNTLPNKDVFLGGDNSGFSNMNLRRIVIFGAIFFVVMGLLKK